MRPLSIILAGLVAASLYALVFERDRLATLAGAERAEAAVEEAPAIEEAAPGVEEGERRVPVEVVLSRAREVEDAVTIRGRTEAAREVEVRSQTSGLVVSEPLRKGAQVEAGALLCELDPGTREIELADAEARLLEARSRIPEAEARVAEAGARLSEAEIEGNAARQLSEGGFASDTRVASGEAAEEAARAGIQSAQATLQGARSGVESAQAGVAAARQALEELEIRAPFGGLLESDTAELGALLQPGGLCAVVIQLDPIKLVGFVPETEVEEVEPGAQAGARLATGREVEGRVTFLSRSADEATRTFRVEIEAPNPDLAIRDGQTAEIAIRGRGVRAHLLPQSALTLDDDGRLGYRLAVDGRAAFAPVTILRDTTRGVQVAGLPEEALVIVTGQEFVADGVALEATVREPAADEPGAPESDG